MLPKTPSPNTRDQRPGTANGAPLFTVRGPIEVANALPLGEKMLMIPSPKIAYQQIPGQRAEFGRRARSPTEH
jgi:hypothetical protein